MFPGLGHSKSLNDGCFLRSAWHLGMVPSRQARARAWDPGSCVHPLPVFSMEKLSHFTIPCLLSHRRIIKAPVPSQGYCAAYSTKTHELLLGSCTKPAT